MLKNTLYLISKSYLHKMAFIIHIWKIILFAILVGGLFLNSSSLPTSNSQLIPSTLLLLTATTEEHIPEEENEFFYRRCACISAATTSCSAAGFVPGTFTYADCVADIQVTCVEIGACR